MTGKTPQSTVDRLILEEASEWFVDFRVGDVDEPARGRFDEWLRRSPEHIRAYMEIARTYVELPPLKLAAKTDVDSLIAYARSGENVVPFHQRGSGWSNEPLAMAAERSDRVTSATPVGRNPSRRLVAAASCAFVFVLAGIMWWHFERFPSYATDIGELRSITLDDGSTVELNARSRLRIEFSKEERRVSLLQGQALFQVSQDKSRPFIVGTGNATVRAVGTQFDVYRKVNGTTVTVLEGRVAVYSTAQDESNKPAPASSPPVRVESGASTTKFAPSLLASRSPPSGSAPQLSANAPGLADPANPAAVFLSAGEQVTVTPGAGVTSPQPADVAATTAWLERRLIFEGSNLSEVVQEFNRYNRRQIVVVGPQLSDFHVSGVYSSTDPASLIRFLRDQAGIKIKEDGNEIRIEPQ